jgi:signal transduction histidine kinase
MHELYSFEVSIHSNGVPTNFEDTLRILLFQAVREALFNIVKHTQTRRATVTLEQANNHIQITVADDGGGFQSDSFERGDGQGGLTRIQRRLNLMGCSLQVQSQPGKSTLVVIRVPASLVSS